MEKWPLTLPGTRNGPLVEIKLRGWIDDFAAQQHRRLYHLEECIRGRQQTLVLASIHPMNAAQPRGLRALTRRVSADDQNESMTALFMALTPLVFSKRRWLRLRSPSWHKHPGRNRRARLQGAPSEKHHPVNCHFGGRYHPASDQKTP